ncbi:MAG: Gfo/Idh/MocA family oxidoreductase [Clostridiales bacterium]|nr:Gfo/Idh/MocA family oxidoreductase [Clostridiales bacterium]
MKRVKTGIIGCGNISGIYLENCTRVFKILDVVALADIDMGRAEAKAAEYGIPKACSVKELLSDPEIEIVINLTIPVAHAEINMAVLEAGKNVYVEKPLAITREDGRKILALAQSRGLLVGCAPDTFLGGGIQTCRKLIDDGWIGKPVAATAFMTCHGHESWHPDPEFYYKVGGGPMFDMGPYYLTALVNLIGPVARVTGSANVTFPERIITSTPKYGNKITVDTPTHIAGIMDFENGAIGTIITSFDIWDANLPKIEIYGAKGSISVPDPNTFGSPVLIKRQGAQQWSEIPLTHSYAGNSRGLGVADMANALRNGRPNRASGRLAMHVLDIMHGFHNASKEGKHYDITEKCGRPDGLPMGLAQGEVD